MAIVALDKLTVYGPLSAKESTLEGLQRLGCVHLVRLRGDGEGPPELVSKEAREALRYLSASPVKRRPTSHRADYDRQRVIDEILEVKSRCAQLTAEREELQRAIEELEPWGSFELPDESVLGDTRFWFWVIPRHQLPRLDDAYDWYLARVDHRFAYVVFLAGEPPQGVPGRRANLDRRPLARLREQLETVEEALEEIRWRRGTLTRWHALLQADLDAADDRAAQLAASQETWEDGALFAIQGWMPRAQGPALREFAAEHGLAVTLAPPTLADEPPTLLENSPRVAGAEGCVTFYITPNYHAWDPTRIVFFSFSIFFAMIVSDAGYGMVMAALLLLGWKRLGQTARGVAWRNLLLGVVLATIGYGILVGSYFGVSPPPGSLLARVQLRIQGVPLIEQQNAMMALSVALGVGHLALANLVSAWRQRRSLRSLGHLGWAVLMVGGFLAGGGTLADRPDWFERGERVMLIGAVAIFLFSSELPLFTLRPMVHLQRLGAGVMQVANLSKAFGDALSYLRLFALGLASAQLAVTFNGLASDAAEVGGVGVLLALVILGVGHGINFLLGLMGGVVHGLRLNCIEFFNWSLTEEGYAFQPFQKKGDA